MMAGFMDIAFDLAFTSMDFLRDAPDGARNSSPRKRRFETSISQYPNLVPATWTQKNSSTT